MELFMLFFLLFAIMAIFVIGTVFPGPEQTVVDLKRARLDLHYRQIEESRIINDPTDPRSPGYESDRFMF